MPKFSIIMQSYLGHYKQAASNREEKILRAVNSVLRQSFEDWELIIVSDGCQKTFDIICLNYLSHDNVECALIPKQTDWSGQPRNYGISKATGEIILYLDIDDQWGKDHLKTINDNFGDNDWVWFNDWIMDTSGKPYERKCLMGQRFQFGTSNIAHKRSLGVTWNGVGYGIDDYAIGMTLLKHSTNHKQIPTPEYIVCHLPGRLDV